ncbi:MAG: ATPase domain-containing protein [Candidatus Eisenbacteria bacterium]
MSSFGPFEPDSTRVEPPIPTSIPGLDLVLQGGFPPGRVYLIQGDTGSGKTTLGMTFVLAGVRRGERCLYITLSETRDELEAVAASHRWNLEGLEILDLASARAAIDADAEYTMFHPSEVELGETTKAILQAVETRNPVRVVIDSLSEMRLLAQTTLRFRHQILAIKHFFGSRDATVLLLDHGKEEDEMTVASLVHGVLSLEQFWPAFGAQRRRMKVVKMRGLRYSGGFHDLAIRTGGLEVFPRLVAAEHRAVRSSSVMTSGIAELDALTGGGLPSGSNTLVVGPSGSGKTTLSMHYVHHALQQGQTAAVFAFEETPQILLMRTRSMGMDLEPYLNSGKLMFQPVDPAELSPGELAHAVMAAVDEHQAKIVVIDSLNGYMHSMPAERFLAVHLHELFTYLNHRDVLTLLISAQHGLFGEKEESVEASYLADNVILIRFFEVRGEMRQAVSVIKKRGGPHERTIRELRMGERGITVGPPLRDMQGVLTGVPSIVGARRAGSDDRAAKRG